MYHKNISKALLAVAAAMFMCGCEKVTPPTRMMK